MRRMRFSRRLLLGTVLSHLGPSLALSSQEAVPALRPVQEALLAEDPARALRLLYALPKPAAWSDPDSLAAGSLLEAALAPRPRRPEAFLRVAQLFAGREEGLTALVACLHQTHRVVAGRPVPGVPRGLEFPEYVEFIESPEREGRDESEEMERLYRECLPLVRAWEARQPGHPHVRLASRLLAACRAVPDFLAHLGAYESFDHALLPARSAWRPELLPPGHLSEEVRFRLRPLAGAGELAEVARRWHAAPWGLLAPLLEGGILPSGIDLVLAPGRRRVVLPSPPPGCYLLDMEASRDGARILYPLFLSDLELCACTGADGALLLATLGGRPAPGVEFRETENGECLAVSDARGLARVPVGPGPEQPRRGILLGAVLKGPEGSQMTLCGLPSQGAGERVPPRLPELAGHLFLDRPFYRPGETVQGRLLLRQHRPELPVEGLFGPAADRAPLTTPLAGRRVALTFLSPGRAETSLELETDAMGVAVFSQPLSMSSEPGDIFWRARISAGKQEFAGMEGDEETCWHVSLGGGWVAGIYQAPIRLEAARTEVGEPKETPAPAGPAPEPSLAPWPPSSRRLRLEPPAEIPSAGTSVRVRVTGPPDVPVLLAAGRSSLFWGEAVRLDDCGRAEVEVPTGASWFPWVELVALAGEEPAGTSTYDLARAAWPRTGAEERSARTRIRLAEPGPALRIRLEGLEPSYGPGDRAAWTVVVEEEGGGPVEATVALTVLDERIAWAFRPEHRCALRPSWPGGSLGLARGLPALAPEESTDGLFNGWFHAGLLDRAQPSIVPGEPSDRYVQAEHDWWSDRPSPSLRTDFRPSAFFAGDLRTGPDGRGRVEFSIPAGVAAWRVIVVAVDSGLRSATLQARIDLRGDRPALPGGAMRAGAGPDQAASDPPGPSDSERSTGTGPASLLLKMDSLRGAPEQRLRLLRAFQDELPPALWAKAAVRCLVELAERVEDPSPALLLEAADVLLLAWDRLEGEGQERLLEAGLRLGRAKGAHRFRALLGLRAEETLRRVLDGEEVDVSIRSAQGTGLLQALLADRSAEEQRACVANLAQRILMFRERPGKEQRFLPAATLLLGAFSSPIVSWARAALEPLALPLFQGALEAGPAEMEAMRLAWEFLPARARPGIPNSVLLEAVLWGRAKGQWAFQELLRRGRPGRELARMAVRELNREEYREELWKRMPRAERLGLPLDALLDLVPRPHSWSEEEEQERKELLVLLGPGRWPLPDLAREFAERSDLGARLLLLQVLAAAGWSEVPWSAPDPWFRLLLGARSGDPAARAEAKARLAAGNVASEEALWLLWSLLPGLDLAGLRGLPGLEGVEVPLSFLRALLARMSLEEILEELGRETQKEGPKVDLSAALTGEEEQCRRLAPLLLEHLARGGRLVHWSADLLESVFAEAGAVPRLVELAPSLGPDLAWGLLDWMVCESGRYEPELIDALSLHPDDQVRKWAQDLLHALRWKPREWLLEDLPAEKLLDLQRRFEREVLGKGWAAFEKALSDPEPGMRWAAEAYLVRRGCWLGGGAR